MSFNPKNYQFTVGEYLNKDVIFVRFQFNPLLIKELKEKFPIAKWNRAQQCWYLPDVHAIRNEIGMFPKTEMGKVIMGRIHPVNQAALKRMHELLLLKSYSPNTIKTYCTEFVQLLYLLKDNPVDTLTAERLRSYFLYCVTKLNLSENIIHSRINAIKFYFEQVLHRDKIFFEEIPRPQKKSSLPKVLSKKDVAKIFAQVDNPKHQTPTRFCTRGNIPAFHGKKSPT